MLWQRSLKPAPKVRYVLFSAHEVRLRTQQLGLRQAAWMLKVSFSVLGDWNKGFNEDMRPFHIPDGRGKTVKITLPMVKDIVRAAEDLKNRGKRLSVKNFTKQLKEEHGIVLRNKKVQEVLIANNLMAAMTRKRRPGFYQSLRKQIPNGLVSLDGSEMTVWLDDRSYKFIVELKSFATVNILLLQGDIYP